MLKLLLLVPVILFAVVALYDMRLVREMGLDDFHGVTPEDSAPRAYPVPNRASRTPFDRRQPQQGEDQMAA